MAENETRNRLMATAISFQRAGRLVEAAAAYEQLLARWPDLPNDWYNLAFVQRRLGRFDAALVSYQEALERGAPQPEEIHLNRGVIYADHLRDDHAAENELNAALARNPAYAPALLNLANLKEDSGDRAAALALYERLLVIAPDFPEALARYANLKSASSPNDPLIDRLRQAIARPDTTQADKASLAFALGKTLNDCASYDAAFEAYTTANRFSRASMPANFPRYDRVRHETFVDELIKTFARPVTARAAGPGAPAPPIFICGMFRSGSTLVEQVLASHPRVTAGGEIGLLPAMVRSDLAPFPAAVTRLLPGRADELASRYLQNIARLFPLADLVTDKRPDNFLYIGLIKSLFPTAKIVHTTRDPLDNCLSIFFLHLDHSMGYALDLMDTAHYVIEHERLMAHWRSLYRADILDFDYDAFVRQPQPAVERLLAFCGLDWDDACLAFQETKNAVKTASVWQVREPLYTRSSGRARHYGTHLAQLRAYLSIDRPPVPGK